MSDIEKIKDIQRFKCLLEYFVTHLEYIINKDANFVGYEKYLKSLVETNVFKEAGQGHKGHNIQKQIERWNNYNGNVICISIYAPNPQSKGTYLNWKSSYYNVRAEFKNEHVDSLYITEEEDKNAKSELKYSVDKLGLFSGLSTNEFNEFFDKYMSYMNVNQTTNNNNKYQEYIDILESNKNLILTGAPGTGKTFLAKKIAEEMKAEYKLVQFHPSYDYTDFVEGLRPIEKDGNIGFERKDGVFKEFCEMAIKDLETTDMIEKSNITIEWDRIGKYIESGIDIPSSKEKAQYHIVSYNNTQVTIRLESNTEYPIPITGIKDAYENRLWEGGQKNGLDPYRAAVAKYIYDKFGDCSKNVNNNFSKKNFVFIIDEINRGEVSKIFGELFYSIDPGYRGEKGRVLTQYQNLVPKGDVFDEDENGFYVPENVYIIGTMNDIDRSVESMDFAFRRRFAFKEIKANENLDMLNDLGEDLSGISKNRLINLNNKISEIEGLNSSYHIGASYFLKLKDYQGDFGKLWHYHLEGLLREYLRGMSDVETKLESLKVAYDNESVSNN